jgi:hypothetical protein
MGMIVDGVPSASASASAVCACVSIARPFAIASANCLSRAATLNCAYATSYYYTIN